MPLGKQAERDGLQDVPQLTGASTASPRMCLKQGVQSFLPPPTFPWSRRITLCTHPIVPKSSRPRHETASLDSQHNNSPASAIISVLSSASLYRNILSWMTLWGGAISQLVPLIELVKKPGSVGSALDSAPTRHERAGTFRSNLDTRCCGRIMTSAQGVVGAHWGGQQKSLAPQWRQAPLEG